MAGWNRITKGDRAWWWNATSREARPQIHLERRTGVLVGEAVEALAVEHKRRGTRVFVEEVHLPTGTSPKLSSPCVPTERIQSKPSWHRLSQCTISGHVV